MTGVSTLEEALAAWDGEQVILRRDAEADAWIIVALHSSALGPACGGTRMRGYAGLREAVVDALALAGGMTLKFAAAGFPAGGGKAVIWPSRPLAQAERDGLLRRYGAVVASLAGAFRTGPDVGTTPRDMDVIAEAGAPYVYCRTCSTAGPEGSAPHTAIGVLAAIELLCARLSVPLDAAHVVVQGVGSVGARLVRRLLAAGARVTIADVDARATAALAGLPRVDVVSPARALELPCDVLSPCALGGALSERSVPRLRCRAIAGAANNMLATPEDDERLRARGVLYAPDFLVNVGGALAITGIESRGWSREQATARVRAAVRDNLAEVLASAARTGRGTDACARELARARLGAGASTPCP